MGEVHTILRPRGLRRSRSGAVILKAADETGFAQASTAGIDSEWNLLFAACSSLPAAEKKSRIQILTQATVRWDTLFHLAEQHGVSCLLYQSFSSMAEGIPPAEMRSLRQCYESNLHKVLLTARELIRILDCLDSCAIEVMPYKGLALAEMLYGDLAARQSGDIDMLIHARDLARVKDAVHDLGYTTNLMLSEKEQRAYLISGYECAFDSAAGKNLLEVQWALQPRFYAVDFDVEAIFQRAVATTVAGRELRTPSAEDLALVLSAHAAKHLWTRLIWLCDFARLMELPEVNWKWIASQARILGIVRILRVSLLLTQQLLGVALPAEIAGETAGDREAQSRAHSIGAQLIQGSSFPVESWQYFRAELQLRERRRDQARFLWRLALTPGPSEWKSVHLPAPLFPLYRLIRLSRLAARLTRA